MSGLLGHHGLMRAAGASDDPYIVFRKTIANLNVDLSDPFRTWTAHGDAAIAGGKLVLGGTGYLSTPNSTEFDFDAGDFCAEAFVNVAASPPAEDAVLAKWGGSTLSWLFGITNARRVFFYYRTLGGNFFPVGTGTVPINTDTHIAAYRIGTNIYASVGGVVSNIVSSIGAAALATVSVQSCIGAQSDGINSQFTGAIKGVRVTKGSSGGYTSAHFTPPTFPLPTS